MIHETDYGEASRDAIEEAMLRLLRHHEFERITVALLMREAGMNRTSFYRLFNSTDDVVMRHYSTVMERFRSSVGRPDSGWPAVRSYIRTMFTTFYADRENLLVLHCRGLTPMMTVVLRRYFPAEDGDIRSIYERE